MGVEPIRAAVAPHAFPRPLLPLLLVLLLAVVAMVAACRKASAPLPAAGVRLDQTSVSGLSSGAYMAGQFQLAHADIVIGAGIVAGGPFGCAESIFADQMPGPAMMLLNASKAANGCMLDGLKLWDVPNPRRLAERARQLAEQGRIGRLADVATDKVFVFSGRQDRVVAPTIVAAAATFYRELGVPETALRHVDTVAAGHGMVTAGVGAACDQSSHPYIVDCGYDLAGEMLAHLYGPLQPRGREPSARLQLFDQQAFTRDLPEHGLAGDGLVYVPEACRREPGCRIHVAFHGCAQNREAVGDAFAISGGLLAWADTNRIVVLFPQVGQGALNPQGCWDWWGYTGRDYLTAKAPQIVAVRRMLEHLSKGAPRS